MPPLKTLLVTKCCSVALCCDVTPSEMCECVCVCVLRGPIHRFPNLSMNANINTFICQRMAVPTTDIHTINKMKDRTEIYKCSITFKLKIQ